MNFLLLIRVKHWLKNLAVFLPIFFAAKFEELFQTNLIFVFISFCLASSSIYILNDILDASYDRNHPLKRNRPIASGFFKISTAWVMFSIFSVFFLMSLWVIPVAAFYVLGYFVLNVFYAFRLRNISIIDVVSISLGFVLRILAGGAGADIFVSHWMIIIVFLLTISIAFAKRRDDLVIETENKEVRKSSEGYSLAFLDIATTISMTITLMAYIMYSVSGEVIERIGTDQLYLTSVFVFMGILRYLQLTVIDKKSGDPFRVFARDRFLQITVLLWGLVFLYLLYGQGV